MIWPFKKRKQPSKPVEDRRGWNEDWKVGDTAVCIRDDWVKPIPIDPKEGDFLVVSGFNEGLGNVGIAQISGLKFEGKPQNKSWYCEAFRKPPAINIEEIAKRGATKQWEVNDG